MAVEDSILRHGSVLFTLGVRARMAQFPSTNNCHTHPTGFLKKSAGTICLALPHDRDE
jgi:hypothetical protein